MEAEGLPPPLHSLLATCHGRTCLRAHTLCCGAVQLRVQQLLSAHAFGLGASRTGGSANKPYMHLQLIRWPILRRSPNIYVHVRIAGKEVNNPQLQSAIKIDCILRSAVRSSIWDLVLRPSPFRKEQQDRCLHNSGTGSAHGESVYLPGAMCYWQTD